MPTGSELLELKVSIPSDLRSAEWSCLDLWIRERAFFMASVNRAEVLDAFRQTTAAYTRGEIGRSEAREQLSDHLKRLNYKPLPGQEGTIKDLRTVDRQNVVLDTNLEQVNGWARWARQQESLSSFPAQQLIRVRNSKKKRPWFTLWERALSHTTREGATGTPQMIALVNHPIWIALSAFNSPYPPFQFGSGMGTRRIDDVEAGSLGLLPGKDSSAKFQAMMQPQHESLNASLAATPEIRSSTIRTGLASALQGFARFQGDTLQFTDPNGTRRTSVEELRGIWEQGLPDGFPLLQRDALRKYLRDPEEFAKKGDRDAWEDFVRLLLRLDVREVPDDLWKGLAFFKDEEDQP